MGTPCTPAWPGFEVEVEALNADPSPMNDPGAETVIDAFEAFIHGPDSDPIIMGHSLGGAMTQVLLNRGLGSVGIGVSGDGEGGFEILGDGRGLKLEHDEGPTNGRGSCVPLT